VEIYGWQEFPSSGRKHAANSNKEGMHPWSLQISSPGRGLEQGKGGLEQGERENRTWRGNETGAGERGLKWGKGELEQGERENRTYRGNESGAGERGLEQGKGELEQGETENRTWRGTETGTED
jgi:hypothetical protein